ncbi:MAG: hypothetical protein ACR2KG_06360 [Nocardioidaceae bacterium]
MKVWVARKVASRTRPLTREAAAKVDAKMSRVAGSTPFARLSKVLDAAILAADPPQALSDAEEARAECVVWVGAETSHGYGTLFAKAAAHDLAAFDKALDVVARALKVLGDTDPAEQRRATAIGILADPQAALDLVADANRVRTCAGAIAEPGAKAARRRCAFGSSTLFVHLSLRAIEAMLSGESHAGAGVARVEDLGPVIADQVRRWLANREVTAKPVIDPATIPPVDCYEVPDSMAEALRLLKPADFFPFSPNTSSGMDVEHNAAHVPPDEGGPPGQTALDNLGRMGRHNHRIKTHGRWKVSQPRSGVWIWRSPHGRYFLIDHAGTTPLGKL